MRSHFRKVFIFSITSMEQEPRICPLCGSPVRLFFINFSEKLLMCEDPNCNFPFGYEELQIVTDESELRENFDTASSISLGPYNGMSAASSVISTAAWSDIEKLNRIYDSEDCMADSRMSFTSDAVKKQRERRKAQKEIQKNLDHIKKLNIELNILKHVDRGSIQNDDWLQNLMTLQGVSGRQLLKEDEIKKLKSKEPDFGMGELKININTVPNDIGLINIEIINEDDELQNKNVCGNTQENKMQLDDKDENRSNNDHEVHQNDKKIDLANNQPVIILNADSDIQGTEENEHQVNNDIHLEEIPINDTLPQLNINLNEINNFVTDSDIICDTNLVDVKNVVIIELKGAIQDINQKNETENIKDIQIDSTNTTVDILANKNNNNQPNISEQKEIESTQHHDKTNNYIMTNANEENTMVTNSNENPTSDDNLNDRNSNDNNNLESEKIDETPELEASAINKDINLLLETQKLQVNYDQKGPSNIVKTNTNLDTKDIKAIHNKSGESEEEQNQEDTIDISKKSDLMNNPKESEGEGLKLRTRANSKKSDLINSSKNQEIAMNNSIESDSDLINNSLELEGEGKVLKTRGKPKKIDLMNSSKDQKDTMDNCTKTDLMNNSNESEGEEIIRKKRGRPKKGTRVVEQPLRRSSRLSK